MKQVMIKSAVGMMSCVAISGSFPFSHGNYCSNIESYYFTNIWAENLQHLIRMGIIDDKIEVLLFDETYAYVIDERVPKEALHAPYFCGIKESIEVLRHHYDVDDEQCLCASRDTNILDPVYSTRLDSIRKYTCPECKNILEIQV